MTNYKSELLIDELGKYYVIKNITADPKEIYVDVGFRDNKMKLKSNIKSGKTYCENFLVHREDGPAIEYNYGCKIWVKNGLTHREDGPALEIIEKIADDKGNYFTRKEWYLNGLHHREDGPAIEWMRSEDTYGYEWYKNGLLHKIDSPAIEYFEDKKQYKYEWQINGKPHKEDGPAIKDANGFFWYINGELHREDGPAIEFNNGDKAYWINGHKISEEKFDLEKELRESIINNNKKNKKNKV